MAGDGAAAFDAGVRESLCALGFAWVFGNLRVESAAAIAVARGGVGADLTDADVLSERKAC